MHMQRVGLAMSLGLAALLAATSARAQSAPEVIQMAPGVVLVVPAGAVTAPAAMPDPAAMIQQMNAQMAQMNAIMQAQLPQAASTPAANGSYSSVVVTSFSDGTRSCTEQISYPGNGAAAQVQVSETGNACGSLGMTPGAEPVRATPLPATAPPVQGAAPLVIADRD